MTREEAIKLLVNATYSDEWQGNQDLTTARNMAIEALEQEPCEDAISREDVIRHICEEKPCYEENCKGITYSRCPDIMWVNELPSVTSMSEEKPKGKYINKDGLMWQCSICGAGIRIMKKYKIPNYCPYCGSEIIKPLNR